MKSASYIERLPSMSSKQLMEEYAKFGDLMLSSHESSETSVHCFRMMEVIDAIGNALYPQTFPKEIEMFEPKEAVAP